MWLWATSSKRSRLAGGGGLRPLLGFLVLELLALPASARVLLTVEEALALAFPGCQLERQTIYLTAEQRQRAAEVAGAEIPSAFFQRYLARCHGELLGTAYFDAHIVRTLPETVMVVVNPDASVRRVEVLSFDEPPDYLPRGEWYAQFAGRELADELALKRGIRAVAGATLTARATTAAVRRVLALHRVLAEPEKKPPAPAAAPAANSPGQHAGARAAPGGAP